VSAHSLPIAIRKHGRIIYEPIKTRQRRVYEYFLPTREHETEIKPKLHRVRVYGAFTYRSWIKRALNELFSSHSTINVRHFFGIIFVFSKHSCLNIDSNSSLPIDKDME
jgi:hypothetical protein